MRVCIVDDVNSPAFGGGAQRPIASNSIRIRQNKQHIACANMSRCVLTDLDLARNCLRE